MLKAIAAVQLCLAMDPLNPITLAVDSLEASTLFDGPMTEQPPAAARVESTSTQPICVTLILCEH